MQEHSDTSLGVKSPENEYWSNINNAEGKIQKCHKHFSLCKNVLGFLGCWGANISPCGIQKRLLYHRTLLPGNASGETLTRIRLRWITNS
jgi:hypothetical protein